MTTLLDRLNSSEELKVAKNENIKDASNYLRGTILDGLADQSTGSLVADDTQLTKFHGIYQQDDRDLRKERRRNKLEAAYSFMIRVRVPGGVCSPKQWLEMDRLANEHANKTLKLTTRQAFQFHGVIKSNLKKTIFEINQSLLDTIAACGDVNRNVMCNPNPFLSEAHAGAQKVAQEISDHLTPQTKAYHEIWLTDSEGEKTKVTEDVEAEVEPLYGKYYLPRKFKICVAVPPNNDVDIFTNDLGYIAIIEDGKIIGYNVTVGGGMGMGHNNEKTFPRLADVMGFCTPEQAVEVAEKVMLVQRDYGDREDRKHARLKYTIEDRGLEWFRNEVESRLGFKLEEARSFSFDNNADRYGWSEGINGNSNVSLYIENGRVRDAEGEPFMTGLREIAKIHTGDFRLTPNQHLIIGNITPEQRPKIEALLKEYNLEKGYEATGLRLNSMACVALPTCGLSLAESERYLPDLIAELEEVIEDSGLTKEAITIRMTGCPNGCARPYVAEIAFVGRAPGKYNVYLGGGHAGQRLNKLYKNSCKADEIKALLEPVIRDYATSREVGEHFGDFVIRKEYVKETIKGSEFHQDFVDH
ncbi:NADPH-dependent assimilatory sulfite reductase hemoprotein subunit [Verrucomicrobia bacterium]|nr:NADPH-dependent assimilatory sulfite reductase hemoprotein subunit [Verrucomicrobiota bacterium]